MDLITSIFRKEPSDRLTAIEAENAAAITCDTEIEKGLAVLAEAEAEFSAKVKEAAKNNPRCYVEYDLDPIEMI